MTEGGLDPHRDAWVPVPLTLDDYNEQSMTYVIEFTAPKQLLLNPQFEAMVHDELLRNADRRGLMVEGQIAITTRDKGTAYTVAEDETVERDATVQDVLLHPEKEEQDAIEQDAIESPYKMSKDEQEYRAKMRANLRDTANESLSFVQRNLDGRELPEGKRFKVDPDAFLEGFLGSSPQAPRPIVQTLTVRAEALIAMDMGALYTGGEQAPEPQHKEEGSLQDLLDSIPDDLSGLDDL